MNKSLQLSKNAYYIQSILHAHNIEADVLELPTSTRTAQDAAQSIGCRIEQIAKSLIFKTVDTHEPILVLVSGPHRAQEKFIEENIAQKIIKADAQFVKAVTGFAIGGVPPIGHKQPIRTLIDKNLMEFQIVWAAAGTPNAVFSINTKDLVALTHGTIITI